MGKGQTASQIAEILGVFHNAVIGKATDKFIPKIKTRTLSCAKKYNKKIRQK